MQLSGMQLIGLHCTSTPSLSGLKLVQNFSTYMRVYTVYIEKFLLHILSLNRKGINFVKLSSILVNTRYRYTNMVIYKVKNAHVFSIMEKVNYTRSLV